MPETLRCNSVAPPIACPMVRLHQRPDSTLGTNHAMPQQSWRCSRLSASSNVHAHFTPIHPWLPQRKTAEVIVVENGEAYSHDTEDNLGCRRNARADHEQSLTAD